MYTHKYVYLCIYFNIYIYTIYIHVLEITTELPSPLWHEPCQTTHAISIDHVATRILFTTPNICSLSVYQRMSFTRFKKQNCKRIHSSLVQWIIMQSSGISSEIPSHTFTHSAHHSGIAFNTFRRFRSR